MYKTYKTLQGTYYIGDKETQADVEVTPESIPVPVIIDIPTLTEQLAALRKAVISGDKADITAIDAKIPKAPKGS